MKSTSATTKSSKTVNIICRIAFKSDPRKVVYLVRSSDGKTQYETSLFDGKATGCKCPATKPCYHMTQCEQIEAARTAHVEANGSVEGFSFVAPVEEKPARKARKIEVPATGEAMVALRSEFEKTRSIAKRAAIAAVLSRMSNEQGEIVVESSAWQFDGDLLFEVVVPSMSAECAESATDMPEECHTETAEEADQRVWFTETDELPELPDLEEEGVADNTPLTEEELKVFENVEDGEIVLADEIKVEQEWIEPAQEEELTPSQAISRVMGCVKQIAANCDGAKEDDGVGFNGTDAKWGRWLAHKSEVKPEDIVKAAHRLQKYKRTQLDGTLPTVAQVERAFKVSSATPQAPQWHNAPLNGNHDFSKVLLHR